MYGAWRGATARRRGRQHEAKGDGGKRGGNRERRARRESEAGGDGVRGEGGRCSRQGGATAHKGRGREVKPLNASR